MFLNERLDFQLAGDASVKRAFLAKPDKVQLGFRTKLFKWTSFPFQGPQGISPWWSYVERTRLPNGNYADGISEVEEYAKRLSVAPRDYARVRSAVSELFGNRMEKLLLIELIVPVYGFVGKAAGQPEFADPQLANVFLIGGSYQLWIPNLTIREAREI